MLHISLEFEVHTVRNSFNMFINIACGVARSSDDGRAFHQGWPAAGVLMSSARSAAGRHRQPAARSAVGRVQTAGERAFIEFLIVLNAGLCVCGFDNDAGCLGSENVALPEWVREPELMK